MLGHQWAATLYRETTASGRPVLRAQAQHRYDRCVPGQYRRIRAASVFEPKRWRGGRTAPDVEEAPSIENRAMMRESPKFSPEVIERAVRMVFVAKDQPD